MLGFCLPSFNKWTVNDIPFLLKMYGRDPFDSDGRLIEAQLGILLESDDGLLVMIDALGNYNSYEITGARHYLFNHGLRNIIESENNADIMRKIVDFTQDENPNTRHDAYDILAKVTQTAITNNGYRGYFDYYPTIINSIRDTDKNIRINSIYWLSELPEAGGFIAPTMRDILHDNNETDRFYASCVLARIDPAYHEPIPILIDALGNSDEWISSLAASSLIFYGSDASDALPILMDLMEKSDHWGIRDYAKTISEIGPGDGSIIPRLTELAANSPADLRETAIEILGNFGAGAESALPALRARLEPSTEKNPAIRTTLRAAIQKIEDGIESKGQSDTSEAVIQGDENNE